MKDILKGEKKYLEKEIKVKGWVKTHQHHKDISFININDGSTFNNLQIVYKKPINNIGIGSAIEAMGKLKKSNREEQEYELEAEELNILKEAINFPIQKNEHSLEYLRENAHIRHRTNIFLAVNHIKHQIFQSIHNFFNEEGFIWIQSPITTENNCEGGAEIFSIDNSDDYFNKETLLSVSGQFHAEALALGMGNVYTFGPTFRAEKSNTSRHLSEFWMIEPEMAFWNLEKTMNLMEKFMKKVTKDVLKNQREELLFLQKKLKDNENLIEKLEVLIKENFEKIEYEKAIEILRPEYPNICDGDDLNSEQEKFITNKYKKPVFVINYPQKIKAFYMKPIANNKVKSVDLLVPEIGELMGGSERISEANELIKNLEKFNISTKNLEWYTELRNLGYHSSSGFGIGFERLVCYITGLKNIKDACTFPRSYKQLRY